MTRHELLEKVTGSILEIRRNHTIRVAIDGVDCAGKTTFADELAGYMKERGVKVIRACIDGFHNPAKTRYSMGKDSGEGYYTKSFNHDAIINKLLKPLGPGGSRRCIKAVYDFRADKPIKPKSEKAGKNSVLLFDGVFLMRPELIGFWDYKIWLDINFDTVLKRAVKRDLYLLGSGDKVRERFLKRYIPGQKIYIEAVDPCSTADIVIKNANPEKPGILYRQQITYEEKK